MSNKPGTIKANIFKAMPAIVFVILCLAGYLVVSSGMGIGSVNAQVNYGRIGESVTEQIDEAARETEQNYSEATSELESGTSDTEEQPVEETETEIPGLEPGLPEGMMEDLDNYEIDEADLNVSSDGVGGKEITDMTVEELEAALLDLPAVPPGAVPTLIPILTRFQEMVRPPWDLPDSTDENAMVPWKADARRYSPFDPAGVRNTQRDPRSANPSPPFPNPEGLTDLPSRPEINAAMIAANLRLRGVMGSEESFRAILAGGGQEKTVMVNDVIAEYEGVVFIVEEISLNRVKISNQARPSDNAFVTFVESSALNTIQEFSISFE
ncbi:MAG TPA: hypothetical protein VGB30_08195 [bacterium]